MTGPSIPADLADLLSQTWLPHAACRNQNPGLFDSDRKVLVELAKRICNTCPVRSDCLTWATTHHEVGTWGGLSESQRASRPGPGRPVRQCGTRPAAELHRRLREPLDVDCQAAWDRKLTEERERGRRRREQHRADAAPGLAS